MDFMTPNPLDYKLLETLEAKSLLSGRITYESFADTGTLRSGPVVGTHFPVAK